MAAFRIADLPWLTPAPADVRKALRSLSVEDADVALPRIAASRLSAEEAASFARAMRRARAGGAKLPALSPLKLGILSNATVDLLADELPVGAARHGVALDLVLPPYDQVQQQAFDPASEINTSGLDAVLVAVDHRWLQLDRSRLDDAEAAVSASVERLGAVVSALGKNSGAAIILQTVPTPPMPLFGSFDRAFAGSLRSLIDGVNGRIVALAAASNAILLDVAALSERVGTDTWFDPLQWLAFKLPFSSSVNGAYADALGRLLGAVRGKVRKCLVLDLDNTVWGGVIGDDGMAGIKIGQGSAMGEAFLSVQAYALELRNRGVMLAVASKNDDANARLPFREHPDMLLREEHISVFQANWTDKASNLEAIARTLNIGVDALVLLDDNPAERAQLRAALPTVAVPELPTDPSWYPWFLASAGYFEAVGFSAEDRSRASSYAAEARRAEVLATSRDLGDYLGSLGMKMSARAFDANNRPRITQLINKTNQFNLTTKRYTAAEVEAAEAASAGTTLQVRLQDSFGDFGMIGVIIAQPEPESPATWEIETWLMSCRVLGRRVEEAMLDQLVQRAQAQGVERLIGIYRPTAKNGMVREHYPRLGFTSEGEVADRDGELRFTLDVASYHFMAPPIAVGD